MSKKQKQLVLGSGYAGLVKNIQAELSALDIFLKRRTAQTYWNVGKMIHEHVLKNKDRADYGSFVLVNLASDVGRDKSTLSRSVQFYRAYPKGGVPQQLTWEHYRSLITIKDEPKREKFEKLALKKEWTSQKLQEAIRLERMKIVDIQAVPVKPKGTIKKLSVHRSELYTYRILEPEFIHPIPEMLVLDLGFTFILQAPSKGAKVKNGAIVESKKKGEEYSLKISTFKPKDLYTYQALVERVVDADTILLDIDLGFHSFARQKVRLRGIDAPELSTKEGQEAKRFVEARLKEVEFVVVKTYKPDKYDRYLADIFYCGNQRDGRKVLKFGHFLNQELLDFGLALEMN